MTRYVRDNRLAGLAIIVAPFASGTRANRRVPDAHLEVRGRECPYVSRGGLKLQAALDQFPIDLSERNCLDLGASTGGFTDVMLERGARRVTSVDVGKGQLHWKLRNDPRVVVMEKTNARYLKPEQFEERFDFLTGDLSFIGLHLILPAAFGLAKVGAQAVFLIKPQFEAGREQVGKGGVVRDPVVHREVLLRVVSHDYSAAGFCPVGLHPSPLKGPAGNIEYLVHYKKGTCDSNFHLEESFNLNPGTRAGDYEKIRVSLTSPQWSVVRKSEHEKATAEQY